MDQASAALVSACGSPWLLRFRALLFEQSERYRRLAIAYGERERDIDGEHRALVRAALDRDVERACALLTEHFARTTDRVAREAIESLLEDEIDHGRVGWAYLAERVRGRSTAGK